MIRPLFGAFEVSGVQWVALLVVGPVLLALEMFVVPRYNPVPLKAALWFGLLWFGLGVAMAIPVGLSWGQTYSIKYLSGFFVEKGLDIDQVLVFAVVVARFRAPEAVARRVIFMALVAALAMRVPFIALGVWLGESDSPLESLLIAALFVATGVLLFQQRRKVHDPQHNRFVVYLERKQRVAPLYQGKDLVIERAGRRQFTLAGVTLVVLLTADLFFAGSVPLAFAYSKPGYLVLASSVFASLGFRSLYYAVDGLEIDMARLKTALGVVFVLVAGQLILHTVEEGHEPTWLIPLLGFVAIAVPVASAVRGIEEEIEEEDELAEADGVAEEEGAS